MWRLHLCSSVMGRGRGCGEDCCWDAHAQCPSLHLLHLCRSHPTVTQQSTGGSKLTYPRSRRGIDPNSTHLVPGLLQHSWERKGKPGQINTHESGAAVREVTHLGLLVLKGCFSFWSGHKTVKCSCQPRRDWKECLMSKTCRQQTYIFKCNGSCSHFRPSTSYIKKKYIFWLLTVGLLRALPVTWGDLLWEPSGLRRHLSTPRSWGFHSAFLVQCGKRIHLREADFSPSFFLPNSQWASCAAVSWRMHLRFRACPLLLPCFFLCHTR